VSTTHLYPGRHSPGLDRELFRNPTAHYRGAPLWAWNTRLREDQLLRQIGVLQEMGMGGFHMHPRTGLATEYLGEEFMAHVRLCAEEAERRGMLAWIYDEDRWPSGAAGGLVTADPRYRAKHLLLTSRSYDEVPGRGPAPPPRRVPWYPEGLDYHPPRRIGNGELLARYEVVLDRGRLASYRRLAPGEPADRGRLWYAYMETALPGSWQNGQTYVDTLDPNAIRRFVELTHERYARAVGDMFGRVVPAIFTDEPHTAEKVYLRHAEDTDDILLPWTTDLGDTFAAQYGSRLEDNLPEIVWELPGGRASVTRYRYHDHVSERFVQATADQLGAWCEEHGLALTGHLMMQGELEAETTLIGDPMRGYRSFGLPGVDILCDAREYAGVKQAQSAARQFGLPGVLAELYGVTGWDFDFLGHKAGGDWLAALGVTTRVHHCSFLSLAGEAKRDYPASISYQSPWYREYPLVEDYFARLGTVLTRGRPRCRIGVIHPIESFWLCFGPRDQTAIEREQRERDFALVTESLLFGLLDFDFVAESLLTSLRPRVDGSVLAVGEARYEAVLVPGLRTLRSTTVGCLEQFAEAGGTVIFAGELPSLVDAAPPKGADRLAALAGRSSRVALTREALLGALEPFREVAFELDDGGPARTLLHQLREDGDRRYVFVCNTDRLNGCAGELSIAGSWEPTRLDPIDGSSSAVRAQVDGAWTQMEWSFPAAGTLLLDLLPGSPRASGPRRSSMRTAAGELADPVPITLSEPNVLLLDQAAWRLDGEGWQPQEEILRIDALLRRRLGWPARDSGIPQPWACPPGPSDVRSLDLRFEITSMVPVSAPLLALEDAAVARIALDGQNVPADVAGWFVDEAIHTVRLPDLTAGEHTLVVTLPYGPGAQPEWCYLLGDFGVAVRGRSARLEEPVRRLGVGDWTTQGLPFYAGNVTYRFALQSDGRPLTLRVPRFSAPLLTVTVDGDRVGRIAFTHELELGALTPGEHRLEVTAYGNRVNAFGAVHCADERRTWWEPGAWRTEGGEWTYGYRLRPMGLLVAPQVMRDEQRAEDSGRRVVCASRQSIRSTPS
jgi:hypothetical protein